ncbi:Kinase D-interacting substrate [Operophtera brumata]|uniref:Kinase D-interacting substrate n=1 Tax=Operophtera brumata TaxID=104452 RepID=A0A0L7LLY1_OPEBR|nr:Kinase D-interacting substrate [Operophtera brumata]
MSLPPHLPPRTADNEYVSIRCLIANIHRPKNVSRPGLPDNTPPPLEIVQESPTSSDTERSGSDRSDGNTTEEVMPAKRAKSNSFAGPILMPPAPAQLQKRRRRSFLPLEIVGVSEHAGPLSAGPHLSVPKFTVTAPPGEHHHRRFSHGFAGFHGFALRRHSNTSLHRSESMVSLACFRTLSQLVNSDVSNELQEYLATNKNVIIDDRDENGTTALMCACDNGRMDSVRLLLTSGADATTADADGWTPLAFAARCGHLAIIKELLDAGAKVDSRDCGGWTPLMWASYKGHEDVVALLLEKGADVHAHGNYNINSLVWAAGRRHSGVVLRLLAAGARPNSCDKYATSALCWASRAGDVTAAGALLRAGADPNTAGMYCWTPLLQATQGERRKPLTSWPGDVTAAGALRRAGADPNTAGMYCWTPLLQATQGNHSEIVQMLIEHKPNVNALDKDGYTALAIAYTPLIHAVKGGHKNIVEALLKKHVDVDLPGKEKKTPVYTAVEKGHVSILKLLLASNPDLEHSTVSGDTPLMRAVRSRHAEMVQLLLERKARVNQIVEILLRNPKNSQLLYKPNKLNETPYNIDMSYNKTILGQIFGARKLNTNEDNENMLGYELYSAALADMLSEPSLSVPITVGLYARWGSGKSFLLNKLKEEMKNFAKQWSESGWTWSWAVSWGAWHAALALGALRPWPAGYDSESGRGAGVSVRAGLHSARARLPPAARLAHIGMELCCTSIVVGFCVLVMYFTDTEVDAQRRKIQQGLLYGACAVSGVLLLANLYTWGRVSCLDAFTGQQTRLVVVVDALDSCEQEKVLALLNAVHALCSDPKSPFILLLAIDPHIISKAVEVNSRRAFSESNIGGWDYLRNMVQLPFYLQNSALRRVKTAQQTAAKRIQAIGSDDFSTSLQRSNQTNKDAPSNSVLAARTRRLRPSESVASSVASGLHRAVPAAGAADLNRVLLTDDYFSDIEFNWYQLASWVNLTEQWPFRTSWLIYHHETYEEHIDDSTSLKHIYDNFHRATLTAADLKIYLPFTINLDPYIKKVIKGKLTLFTERIIQVGLY